MSFVVKRKRECSEKIEKENKIKASKYSSQKLLKEFKPSNFPFIVSTSKRNNYSNDNPGPGEYNQDINAFTNIKNLTRDYNENNKMVCLSDNSMEKIGFIQKDKRFKYGKPKLINHCQGFYFPPLSSKMQIFNKSRAVINKVKKKLIALKKESSILSITKEKENKIDTMINGILIKTHNPKLYKTFTGEKRDKVKPDSYEIDVSKKPHNTN